MVEGAWFNRTSEHCARLRDDGRTAAVCRTRDGPVDSAPLLDAPVAGSLSRPDHRNGPQDRAASSRTARRFRARALGD